MTKAKIQTVSHEEARVQYTRLWTVGDVYKRRTQTTASSWPPASSQWKVCGWKTQFDLNVNVRIGLRSQLMENVNRVDERIHHHQSLPAEHLLRWIGGFLKWDVTEVSGVTNCVLLPVVTRTRWSCSWRNYRTQRVASDTFHKQTNKQTNNTTKQTPTKDSSLLRTRRKKQLDYLLGSRVNFSFFVNCNVWCTFSECICGSTWTCSWSYVAEYQVPCFSDIFMTVFNS